MHSECYVATCGATPGARGGAHPLEREGFEPLHCWAEPFATTTARVLMHQAWWAKSEFLRVSDKPAKIH